LIEKVMSFFDRKFFLDMFLWRFKIQSRQHGPNFFAKTLNISDENRKMMKQARIKKIFFLKNVLWTG